MKWTINTLADCHSDVVLHLGGPGAGVEEVVVSPLVHHPGSLCHQPLLQQVVQTTLQDLHSWSLEIYSTWMQFSNKDDGSLECEGLVLFP